MMFYFLLECMLVSEPESGLVELFGEVFIELVHSVEFCLEVCVGGSDLFSNIIIVHESIRITWWLVGVWVGHFPFLPQVTSSLTVLLASWSFQTPNSTKRFYWQINKKIPDLCLLQVTSHSLSLYFHIIVHSICLFISCV